MVVQCWTFSPKLNVQQQFGGHDCGLFAIAFTLQLALEDDQWHILFDQSKMQPNLLKYFQKKKVGPFRQKGYFKSNREATLLSIGANTACA